MSIFALCLFVLSVAGLTSLRVLSVPAFGEVFLRSSSKSELLVALAADQDFVIKSSHNHSPSLVAPTNFHVARTTRQSKYVIRYRTSQQRSSKKDRSFSDEIDYC